MSITLYSVGHGRRSGEELLEILTQAGIKQLVDVRAYPRSARHPWFNDVTLQPELERTGLAYRWLGGELGGRRAQRPDSRHVALRAGGLRAFADHMETPEFAHGIGVLIGLARRAPTAMMCAEGSPMNCHRSMIADFLTARGIDVLHLLNRQQTQHHALHRAARNESGRLIYDQTEQRGLSLE